MSTLVPLSMADLILAAVFVLANGVLSVVYGLGIERRLIVAALRMVVQLAAIGFVLKLVFQQSSPLWTMLIALVMIGVAGWESLARQTHRIKGPGALALGSATLLAVGLLSTLYVTTAVIGSEPWYAPRVFLPILGMILGNALTAVALVLETLTTAAHTERAGIEARLAMGHKPLAAFQGIVRRALTTALMPMLNSMAVSGLVTLPGMMTGQILSGVDPVEAAKYQIMIMFVIAGSSALAAAAAAFGSVRLVVDERARLRLDRMSPR
ncbi:MAG: ABC transporter permease [Hyphomicrobiaceae bacterium]